MTQPDDAGPSAVELAYAARDELIATLLHYSGTMPRSLIEIGKLALSGPGKLMSMPDDPAAIVRPPRWPLYVLLSYLAASTPEARSSWRHALPAAAAVEIAMAAADLLDELTDDDPSSVAGRYGYAQALNTGSLMLVMAQEVLARHAAAEGNGSALAALSALQEMLVEAATGQHLDMLHSGAGVADVSLEEGLRITSHKAGALVSGACRVGACMAGAPEALVEMAGSFGRDLGTIAQLANDIEAVLPHEPTGMDAAPNEDKTDLRLRRPTLPIIFTLREEEGEANALRRAYSQPPGSEGAEEEELRRAVLQAGGVHFAQLLIEVHMRNAENKLEEMEAARPGARGLLAGLLPTIT